MVDPRQRPRYCRNDCPACAAPPVHLAHAEARHLLDNGIYGLTKKQSSPTTPRGTHTNTHPQGSLLPPLNPLTTTLAAEVDEFARVYEAAGFTEIDARLIERPTPMPNGIGQWVTTFRRGWLDRAGVPEEERAEIGEAVAESVGSPIADYVRLRFIMRKPH